MEFIPPAQQKEAVMALLKNPGMLKGLIVQQALAAMPDADSSPEMRELQLLRDDEVLPYLHRMVAMYPPEVARQKLMAEHAMPPEQVDIILSMVGVFNECCMQIG